jgi:hypothetical protein
MPEIRYFAFPALTWALLGAMVAVMFGQPQVALAFGVGACGAGVTLFATRPRPAAPARATSRRWPIFFTLNVILTAIWVFSIWLRQQ